MINKCDDCKFAKWDLDSVENALCNQNPILKIIGEDNYVTSCSAYQTTNIIKCIINWIKKPCLS